MSAHSEIVRSYIELRNYLAKSNPQPNMEFEIKFKIIKQSLMAFNTQSGAVVEVAKVRPNFPGVFVPHYGCMFERYSTDLIKYINENLLKESKEPNGEIVSLASRHKSSLNLKKAYEPN